MRARRAPLELTYQGAVTLGSPGRARLHDRRGGLSDFVWQAFWDADWVGQTAGIRPSIELTMSVAARPPDELAAPRFEPLDGGARSLHERGASTDDGRFRQGY